MIAVVQKHIFAFIVTITFAILASIYSVVTPVFEASDEISHYPMVQFIATHHTLPIQQPGVETMWEQEGSQPPLYYILGAALTFWVDTADLTTARNRNPHAKLGIPLDQDNKNMILHSQGETFPWRGTVLAIHILRFWGMILGSVTVWLTYLLAKETWPDDVDAVQLAVTLVAFNPMFLFITGSVNNDNLVIPLSTWTLLLLARILRHGITYQRAITLGVVIALATLTKISGLTLLPTVALTTIVSSWRTRRWREGLMTLGIVGLGCVLVAGWWYWRNMQLYHELLGINMQVAIAGGRQITIINLIKNEWYGFWVSYWALFGAVNILADTPVYWFYGLLTIMGLIGSLIWVFRQALAKTWDRLVLPGLAITQILITFAGLVRWTLVTYASQGRLMFPVIGAISILGSQGILTCIPHGKDFRVSLWFSGALLIIAIISPFRYIAPAYAPPPTVARVPEQAIPVGAYFDGMELIAVDSPQATTHEGEWVPLTLYWKTTKQMNVNYSFFLHALGRDYREIGKIDTYPGGGALPTSSTQVGEIVKDTYFIPIRDNIETPTRVRVLIGMGIYSPPTYTIIPAVKADGEKFGDIVVDAGVVYPADMARCDLAHPPTAIELGSIGGFATLWSDSLQPVYEPGAQVPVVLYWTQTMRTSIDWTVFVHLTDEHGTIIAQADSPPLNNDYPTNLWRLPCEVKDVHVLHIPDGSPAGDYPVLVGLYDASDPGLQRALALGVDQSPFPDNAILLGNIHLSTP